MNRQGITRNFVIENDISVEILRRDHPNIIFYPLTSRITSIEVSPEADTEFEQLRKVVDSIFIPLLFGLNAIQALEEVNISQFHNYPYGELRGEGVLIGFVDTGIDYNNSLFQYEDRTTRIASIWDQTIEGSAPAIYSYGTEYTSERINEALGAPDPYAIVPSRDEIGHGTFLAGVAAGYDRSSEGTYKGGAPDAMLVVVKLRPAREYLREYYLIEEDAIAYQADNFMQGVDYILDVARRQDKPVVVCVGLGDNHGAHDGTTITERFLREVSAIYDVITVVSAGNEANKGHHYSGTLIQGAEQNFEVNVDEDERGFILQLWGNAPDKIIMGITSPLGKKIEKIPLDIVGSQKFILPLEKVEINFSYEFPNFNTGAQKIEVRLANPTPGLWTFTVYGELIIDGTYNLWLPREGFIKDDTRFLRPDPFITVCIPATEKDVIVVGAYDNINDSVYAASGRGPTTNQVIKPDLIAPGVNILGPVPGGGFTTYTGTSVAAAITASAAALLLEWGVVEGNLTALNTRIARTILNRGAKRKLGIAYPNPTEGYGRLDLKNSLSLV